uniref:Predicted protein n=1 Tax=Hordeum vulgare subsp. vulgare TaxID=112509 RepID=F2DZJ1_HORVV|nr:predicted protein [Hordeum vulgare subsp. vulgare]
MKTEVCQFTGFKIYPGHGKRYVRADNKAFTLINGKAEANFLMRRNPREIRWTQIYRRLHRKGASEEVAKKKTRKVQKMQRAIVGASLEVIKQKRAEKPEQRAASREAALKEVKDRKKAKAAATKKTTSSAAKTTSAPKQTKQAKQAPAKKGTGQKR